MNEGNHAVNYLLRLQVQATLCLRLISLPLLTLIDSGVDQNFLDADLASQAGIVSVPLDSSMEVCALNGRLLVHISHHTEPLQLILYGNHREYLQFFYHLSTANTNTLVIGHLWLKLPNPHIDWSAGKIISWGSFCHSTCLQYAHPPAEGVSTPLPTSPAMLTSVLSVYHGLDKVFSKERAVSLPPHWPYDCAIEFLPGATLLSCQL